MKDDEFLGEVAFSLSASVAPWVDPGDYVQTVIGKAYEADSADCCGEITLKLVGTTEAINQGQHLVLVFDTDASLEGVMLALFEADGETREELDITPGWNNLLVVESVEIAASVAHTRLRVQLLETSMALFCPHGLTVAQEDSLELSVEDWRRLGFQRIHGEKLIFRDQLKLNPYQRRAVDARDQAAYLCNDCGEEIVIPIDYSQGSHQQYVEDCPVCCRPNVIHVTIDEDGNASAWAEPEQD